MSDVSRGAPVPWGTPGQPLRTGLGTNWGYSFDVRGRHTKRPRSQGRGCNHSYYGRGRVRIPASSFVPLSGTTADRGKAGTTSRYRPEVAVFVVPPLGGCVDHQDCWLRPFVFGVRRSESPFWDGTECRGRLLAERVGLVDAFGCVEGTGWCTGPVAPLRPKRSRPLAESGFASLVTAPYRFVVDIVRRLESPLLNRNEFQSKGNERREVVGVICGKRALLRNCRCRNHCVDAERTFASGLIEKL